jgi:Family of unknown function (DUF6364)
MKNVTISLSDSVIKQARLYAAKKSKSLSALISEMLEELVNSASIRKQAMDEFKKAGTYFNSKGKKFNRDEIYDRKVLR